MELRRILYGYTKVQFQYQIQPEEAQIVRRIFDDYIQGKTLLEIANGLSAKEIVYFKDKTTWTKNAVKRILENTHYMGDSEYERIIEKNIFKKAEKIRLSKGGKREKDSKEIKYLKYSSVCGECGSRFTRMSKYHKKERWHCSKKCCYTKKYIDDNTFLNMIFEILKMVKNSPELLDCDDVSEIIESQELLKKERNIKSIISQSDISFSPCKKLIFEFVNEQFDCMYWENGRELTEELKMYIISTELKTGVLDIEFMKNTVSKIIVLSDGNIKIRFINGREISNISEGNINDAS